MENKKFKNQKQPIIYWLVEITLTSGDELQFYVKAPTQIEADEKAEGYVFWISNKVLSNKLRGFNLMI